MKLFTFFKSKSLNKGNPEFYRYLNEVLRQKPKDFSIYKAAFTHPAEQQKDALGNPVNYQRLEYLGDALIGSITAKYFFDEFPLANEGKLTKMRAKIVSRKTLNQAGEKLGLTNFIDSKISAQHLGKHISGDLFEALTGAIYCDLGEAFCAYFIDQNLLRPFAGQNALKQNIVSYKDLIVENCQKHKKAVKFKTESISESNNKGFLSKLFISGEQVAQASAESKKKAEEMASHKAQIDYSVIHSHE